MIRQLILICCALAVGATTTAYAHSVWIEPKDGQLVIRFAEPGNDFEKSPGYLDNLSAPIAFRVVTNKPTVVEASKAADCFLLKGASPADAACVETTFTVRGGRKPIFYARWQADGTPAEAPRLTLDLVPIGKPGEVRLYFRGQPLGGIEATLRTPDEKETGVTADAGGFLHFNATAPGQYLLTVAHYREPLAGFHMGVPYTETSHNAALTWRQH